MPHPGEILGDRYRLDDRIAAGGMGEVWQATDTVLGRDVAVKTLHAGQATDAGFQTRFRHEARAMAVLHHPGVADVYDYGQSGPDAYIVMARVHGEALNQRIAERGRLTPVETMSIVAQAGRALEAAHQAGIVHRDVKPGNLLIQADGTVVLVDFGVARSAESAALTGAKEVVGTALYIAPEQVSKEETGPLADVYALGVVAYHCLAGHPPFLGDSPIAVALQHVREDPPPLPADVPPAVAALVTTAMAKNPADRYASAADMAAAADQAVGGADTTAVLAVPGVAAAPGLAAAPGVAAVSAAGLARSAAPGNTAVFPAVAPPPVAEPSPSRRRGLLLAAVAAVLLATAIAVFATDPGGILPGNTPPANSETRSPGASKPAAPASVKATTKGSTKGNSSQGGAAASAGATTTPTGAAQATTQPTPSRTPSTEATTTKPEPTATTEPAATTPTTSGGGGADNSGPGGAGGGGGGGGNQGAGGGQAEAAPTPTA